MRILISIISIFLWSIFPAKASVDLIDYIPAAEQPLLFTTGVYADQYLADAVASIPNSEGDILNVPCGLLKFNQSITIVSRLHFVGCGGGLAGNVITEFKFAADIPGIVIAAGGAGAIIEGIQISGSGTVGNGIVLFRHATLRQLTVRRFGENCIDVDGTGSNNANGWLIEAVRVFDCGGDGLHIDGGDSNAGISIAFDAVHIGGWGINDSSFLGNTHIAPQVSDCTLGPYKTDNPNARSTFIGAYSEPNQPPSDLQSPTIVVGGLHAAGIIGDALVINNDKISPFIIVGDNPDRTVKYSIGKYAYSGLEADIDGDSSHGWSWLWWDENSGNLQLRFGRTNNHVVANLTTTLSNAKDEDGISLGGGNLLMNGVWAYAAIGAKYRYIDFLALDNKIKDLEQRVEDLENQ